MDKRELRQMLIEVLKDIDKPEPKSTKTKQEKEIESYFKLLVWFIVIVAILRVIYLLAGYR